MPKRKVVKVEMPPSAGKPPSKEFRKIGWCYDCGEHIETGPCGPGSHTRMFENGRVAFVIEFCCKCAGHGK